MKSSLKQLFPIQRLLAVFCGVFVILLATYLLRGRGPRDAALESGLWAAVSTAVFFAARLYHARRGRHCELCGDTPEPGPGQPQAGKEK